MKALVFLPPDPVDDRGQRLVSFNSKMGLEDVPRAVLTYYNNLGFDPVVRRAILADAAFVTRPGSDEQVDIRNRKIALPMDEADVEDIALDALQWLAEHSSRLTDHGMRRITIYRDVLARLNIALGNG